MIVIGMLAAVLAAGASVDSFYALSAEVTPSHLVAKGRGQFHVYLKPFAAAHISKEAPFKVDLIAQGAKLAKEHLTLADSVPSEPTHFFAEFVAGDKGTAHLTAKVTFFICTEKLCIRQQKQLSVATDIQ